MVRRSTARRQTLHTVARQGRIQQCKKVQGGGRSPVLCSRLECKRSDMVWLSQHSTLRRQSNKGLQVSSDGNVRDRARSNRRNSRRG